MEAELGVHHRAGPALGPHRLGHYVHSHRRHPDEHVLHLVAGQAVGRPDSQQRVDGTLVVAAAGVGLDAGGRHLQRPLPPALQEPVGAGPAAVGGQKAPLTGDSVFGAPIAVGGQQGGLHPAAGGQRRVQALGPGPVDQKLHAPRGHGPGDPHRRHQPVGAEAQDGAGRRRRAQCPDGAGGVEMAPVVGGRVGGPAGPAHHLVADGRAPHQLPLPRSGQRGRGHDRREDHHPGVAGGGVVDVVVLDGVTGHRVGHGGLNGRGRPAGADDGGGGRGRVPDPLHGATEADGRVGGGAVGGHPQMVEQQGSHRGQVAFAQVVVADLAHRLDQVSGQVHGPPSLTSPSVMSPRSPRCHHRRRHHVAAITSISMSIPSMAKLETSIMVDTGQRPSSKYSDRTSRTGHLWLSMSRR